MQAKINLKEVESAVIRCVCGETTTFNLTIPGNSAPNACAGCAAPWSSTDRVKRALDAIRLLGASPEKSAPDITFLCQSGP